MDAAIAALAGTAVGAVIGVAGSLGTTWLQQRGQSRRERMKAAIDLGLADFNHRLKLIEKTGGTLTPLTSFVWYHNKMLEALDRNSLDADAVAKIDEEQIAMLVAMKERSDRHKTTRGQMTPSR